MLHPTSAIRPVPRYRRYHKGRVMPTLAEQLAGETREAHLYRVRDGNRVECFACGHRCPIPPGFAGVCKVRFNRDGKLYAPFGYVNAAALRPHREEAVLPRPAGHARAQLRHAGLRFALRLLPELGVFPGAARFAVDARISPHRPARELVRLALRQGAAAWSAPTTSR